MDGVRLRGPLRQLAQLGELRPEPEIGEPSLARRGSVDLAHGGEHAFGRAVGTGLGELARKSENSAAVVWPLLLHDPFSVIRHRIIGEHG